MLIADQADAVVGLARQLVAFDPVNPGLVPGAAGSAAGAAPPARTGAPYWMESALWQAHGVPAVVRGPAGGGLPAAGEWVDLAQPRRYPVAVADTVGRFLAG